MHQVPLLTPVSQANNPEVVLTASDVNSTQDSVTAWIIGEAEGMSACRKALTLKGIHVVKSWVLNDLKCPKMRSNILTEMRNTPPSWFWINASNEVYKWGGEDGKRLSIFIATLIRLQLDNQRHIVLQGAIANTRGWHSERFDKLLKHPRLYSASVKWCALGIQVEPAAQTCFYTRVFATIEIPLEATLCCNREPKSKLRIMPQSAWTCYHNNLIELLLPHSFVGASVKKSKPKVPFVEGIDGPGEHADVSELNVEPERRKKLSSVDVQNHWDDCGDNCSAIHVVEAFSVFDDIESTVASEEDLERKELEGMFDSVFFNWAMPGSDMEEVETIDRPFSNFHDNIHSVLTALESHAGTHDVAEIYGGNGNVITCSIRRKLVGGRNFDITTNINLLEPKHIAGLWTYLRVHKPKVVVLAPPCTAFGPWSFINRKRNPASFFHSRRIGKKLADLAADICLFQLNHGRHYIAENPRTSQLWELESWKEVLKHSVSVVLDQCTLGLKDPVGIPTLKPTLMVASHWTLIKRLDRRCDYSHQHAQLAGSVNGVSRCRYAQTWPRRMIELIVEGICELLSSKHSQPAFPVVRTTCPGCRAHAARHDPRHDRGADCKFPYEDEKRWNCAACKLFKPSTAPGHSYELDDCQWAEARTRQRTQYDRQPMTPKVTAHQAPRAPDEDSVEIGEAGQSPQAPANLSWSKVVNLETITWLDIVRVRDGWHPAPGNMTLVMNYGRALRSCEPRLNAQIWKFRSTFGFFPDNTHDHGQWWQLEDRVDFTAPEYDTRIVMPYPVPILVHIYQDDITDSPPTENKTRTASRATPQKIANIFDKALEIIEGTSSSSSRPAARDRLDGEGPADPAEHDIPEQLPDIGEDVPIPEPDWTTWDLGRTLRKLKSDIPGVKVQALRKLHVRWYHCSASRMYNVLQAAGLDKDTLKLVSTVVDTCRACRTWKKPANRSYTSSRLSSTLNEVLQIDLLFTSGGIILHALDEATRFTMTGILSDRTPRSIIDWLTQHWMRVLGPPKIILSDQEGGLCGDEAAIWAERHQIELRLRPKGAHATTVERHHQIFRDQLNKIRSQVAEEKLQIPFEHLVAEATYAKNSLTLIGGYSPYQAVFGVTPRFLAEVENPGQSTLTDGEGGIFGSSRHAVRLREIALEAIVAATAKARMQRAEQSNTRVPGQAVDLQIGEAVDIWRLPSQKDLTGWRGPCTVVSTHDLESGYIDVKWQGRVMSARLQDIRKSLSLFIGLVDSGDQPIQSIQRYLHSLSNPSTQVLSWVETPGGWQLSKAAQENGEVYQALRHVAHNVFGLSKCYGARIGRGPCVLSGVVSAIRTIIVWWPVNQPALYRTIELAAEQRCELRNLFDKDVDTAWIQFIDASNSSVKQLRRRVPDDPYLGEDHPPARDFRENMSDADTLLAPSAISSMSTTYPHPPPHPPPYPHPQPIPIHTRLSQPVETTRSRTSYNPSMTPSHSSPTTTRTPHTEKRPIDTQHNQGPPNKNPHIQKPSTSHEAASHSWQTPTHIPQLPTQDNDNDTESLASTIPYQEDVLFTVWNYLEYHCASFPGSTTDSYMACELERYEPVHCISYQCWLITPPRPLQPGEFCVYDVVEQTPVIEREFDELSALEVKQHKTLVEAAIRKELSSFTEHKCFLPVPKGSINNVLTSRWLFKWKTIDGIRTIKARLVVHGFKDSAASTLTTYANTTSRWGQRVINSIATQRQWKLRSADIGTAFLQGLTFEQLASLTGEPLRVVGLIPPRGCEQYFKEMPDLKNVNFQVSDLKMVKAVYGLKDAPRAWRKKLHQIFTELRGHSLNMDQAIYCWHDSTGLICVVSTHVDDLKLAGTEKFVSWFLKELETRVGKLKLSEAYLSGFEHCGIMHEQDKDYAVTIHQNHYASRLHPADISNLDVTKPNTKLEKMHVDTYLSLLGALSWLSQTRQDICIYVCALQRCAKSPTIENIIRLNKVTKWIRRVPSFIRYEHLQGPIKCLVIADSAFRKEDASGLAMKGSVVGLTEKHAQGPGGRIHMIEWFSRKQRRVTRSTFSAELHSAVDGIETAKVILQAILEIMSPAPMTPAQVVKALDNSTERLINIELCTDCRSLYDTLSSEDVKCPSENSLIMVLLSIKEQMKSGLIECIHWIDTHDMLADALNKGVVSRAALLLVGKTGHWKLVHDCLTHREKQVSAITSAEHEAKNHMLGNVK